MDDPPTQRVPVMGDELAKEFNARPAYTRTSKQREVHFTCRRCGEEVIEWRFPGPQPWYCPTCRETRTQEREAGRSKRQRERRQKGDVQHHAPGKRMQAQDPPPHTAAMTAPAAPEIWANFLPTTVAVLTQICDRAGEYFATEVVSALQIELDHLRTTLGRERQEALIQLFELGDQLAYAGLVDVGVDAGVENWSTFANLATLDQLRAAVRNARCLAGAAERRRKLAQLSSPDQPEGLKVEQKTLRVEFYLEVQGNSKFVRGETKARTHIEDWVLSRYTMEKQPDGITYHLTIPYSSNEDFNRIVSDEILREAASIADGRHCFIEADVRALDGSERSFPFLPPL